MIGLSCLGCSIPIRLYRSPDAATHSTRQMNGCIDLKRVPVSRIPVQFQNDAAWPRGSACYMDDFFLIRNCLGKNFPHRSERTFRGVEVSSFSSPLSRATVPLRLAYKGALSGNAGILLGKRVFLTTYMYLQLNSSREHLSVITRSHKAGYLTKTKYHSAERGTAMSDSTHRHLLPS